MIDCVVEDITWLGHVKLLLKGDNEEAINSVITEALKSIRVRCDVQQVGQESSVPYDPKTNGSAELGVKLVKGQFLVLKSCLEHKIGRRTPVNHPLLTWLVGHAADVRTFRVRDRCSGRTAYQVAKCRQFLFRVWVFS